MILVRDGVAASGERVLTVGPIFRRLPSEGAARHVELIGQPLDRDLPLENQSRGRELELPVVAFSWHSLNTFPIETLDYPCPLYCPSPRARVSEILTQVTLACIVPSDAHTRGAGHLECNATTTKGIRAAPTCQAWLSRRRIRQRRRTR